MTVSVPSSAVPAGTTRSSGAVIARWAWPLLGLVLVGYGLIAFNAGSTLSPALNSAENPGATTAYILEQASNGVDMTGTAEVQQVIPGWVNLMAQLSSSAFAYGDDGLLETELYYYSMSDSRRTVLSTHMMLGLVLMATGFLQFWPAFRRRFRKTHRVLGVVYVLAAFTSMTMSGIHLVNTGVANTYDNYVFHVGLWIMLVGVVVSLSMAGLAILRRDIARHLGWQALGFGFLMTAPLQRIDWLALSTVAGETSFNEMNMLVNTVLFAQAILAGYALFRLNRDSSPVRRDAVAGVTPMSANAVRVVYLVLAALALLTLLPALTVTPLADLTMMQRMVPASALAWLSAVVGGATGMLFSAATAALLLSGFAQLRALRAGNVVSRAAVMVTSALVVGVMALVWAWQLGMPSHAHSIAGGAFAVLGTCILFFLERYLQARRKGQQGKALEWLQFLLLSALSPALMLVNLWLFDVTSAVPQPYLGNGDGYELASIGALFTPLLAGFLLSVYSRETDRYRVS